MKYIEDLIVCRNKNRFKLKINIKNEYLLSDFYFQNLFIFFINLYLFYNLLIIILYFMSFKMKILILILNLIKNI